MGGGSDNGGVFSSQEVAEDQLRIIGVPPKQIYIGSQFSFEFGITGGSGNYRVRYIQDPSGIVNDDVLRDRFVKELAKADPNPIAEFEIQEQSLAKPSFRLSGVPGSSDPVKPGSYSYFIEVSDGDQTEIEKYDFELRNIVLSISTAANGLLFEGSATVGGQSVANTRLCDESKVYEDSRIELPSGEIAYLSEVIFSLDSVPTERVNVFYSTVTAYNEGFQEFSNNNKTLAREGADYLETKGVFQFEPGEVICVLSIPLLDDSKMEGTERFSVEATKATGGTVEISSARLTLEIRDDEPEVIFEPEDVILSLGDNSIVPVSLSAQAGKFLEAGFFKNSDSTVPDSYFSYQPLNRNLFFGLQDTSASFSVAFDSDIGGDDWGSDFKLVTSLNLSDVFGLDDHEVLFNEWPLMSQLNNEVIAEGSNGESVTSIAASNQGLVSVGLNMVNASGDEYVILKTFYRNGKPFQISGSEAIELSEPGVDINIVDLVYKSSEDSARLLALLSVDGKYGSVDFGGTDLALAIFDVSQVNGVVEASVLQLGTEQDDVPVSIELSDREDLYILAESTGNTIETSLPNFANNGGIDALVYRVNLSGSEKVWARFVGDQSDNSAISLKANGNRVSVLTKTDSQSRVDYLSADDFGADLTDLKPLTINFLDDQSTYSLLSASNGERLALLSSGVREPASGNFTPSRSIDGFLSNIEVDESGQGNSKLSSFIDVATNGKDEITHAALLNDDAVALIAGSTSDKIANNTIYGGVDVFVQSVDFEEAENTRPPIQFGTPGTDRILDVAPVLDEKFMVLWSEDHSSGDGSLRYRVSAFAPDGRKLSLNP